MLVYSHGLRTRANYKGSSLFQNEAQIFKKPLAGNRSFQILFCY